MTDQTLAQIRALADRLERRADIEDVGEVRYSQTEETDAAYEDVPEVTWEEMREIVGLLREAASTLRALADQGQRAEEASAQRDTRAGGLSCLSRFWIRVRRRRHRGQLLDLQHHGAGRGHPHGEPAMTDQTPDTLRALDLEELIRLLRCVRVRDCGAHYCRYCPARSPKWEHSPSCPYVESQQEHEDASAMIATLRALADQGQRAAEDGPLPNAPDDSDG